MGSDLGWGARMGKCFLGLCSPGMQSSLWVRDPQSSPDPLEEQLKCFHGALLLPGPTALHPTSIEGLECVEIHQEIQQKFP